MKLFIIITLFLTVSFAKVDMQNDLIQNKKTYSLYKKLYNTDPSHLANSFHFARAAFKLKKYDEALKIYKEILQKVPTSSRIKLEIARTYFEQKRYKKAKEMFAALKEEHLPFQVLKNIKHMEDSIDKRTKRNFFNITLVLGTSYDSNINNRASSENIFIPKYNTTFTNTTKDESSSAFNFAVNLKHQYKYTNNIYFKNQLLFYMKNVSEDKDKDIIFSSYSPTIIHNINDKLKVEYSLFMDYMEYESQHYMNTYGIYPNVKYKYSNDTELLFSHKFQKKKNKISANSNKDSVYNKSEFGFNKYLNKNSNLKSKIFVESEKKDTGILTNIDYNSVGASFLYKYKYSKNVSISPFFQYKQKKYTEQNNLYLKNQENNEYTYNMELLYMFENNWISQLNFQHNDIQSNIKSAQYEKNVMSLNFIKNF